jgi:hypothetical protein
LAHSVGIDNPTSFIKRGELFEEFFKKTIDIRKMPDNILIYHSYLIYFEKGVYPMRVVGFLLQDLGSTRQVRVNLFAPHKDSPRC